MRGNWFKKYVLGLESQGPLRYREVAASLVKLEFQRKSQTISEWIDMLILDAMKKTDGEHDEDKWRVHLIRKS